MANSFFNMTGLAIQYGLNSALRTLCPQAVGSGRSRELSGIYVQRASIVALVALVPSVCLAFSASRILIAVGQPPELADLAQQYVVRIQPALAGIAFMTVLQRVLQAEGHIMANFYICFFVFVCAPILQYALINVLGWGFYGAAYAFSIYNCLYIVIMIPYMVYAGMGHVFTPRREALSPSGMYSHLALALPGLACQLLEWASMELVSIAAGTRPSARILIGSMGMMLNIEAIFAMCWVPG
jgi:MATE family multidrug resistance protein